MRSLMVEPEALLLDEPFFKLDASLRDKMRRFAFALVKFRPIPPLIITHAHEDAAAACGEVKGYCPNET